MRTALRNDGKTQSCSEGGCRARPRFACDRRGILLAACGILLLAVIGLSTWALVESITGFDQVSTFWTIEEALRNQVCAMFPHLCAKRRCACLRFHGCVQGKVCMLALPPR